MFRLISGFDTQQLQQQPPFQFVKKEECTRRHLNNSLLLKSICVLYDAF